MQWILTSIIEITFPRVPTPSLPSKLRQEMVESYPRKYFEIVLLDRITRGRSKELLK